MNIRDFIPPLVINFLRRSIRPERHYENYEIALKACSKDAYQNSELCNMIADKTLIHSKILKEKPYTISPINAFFLAAIYQLISNKSKKVINLLDFGGACGAHYFEIRRFIPEDIRLKWTVIETSQMVDSAIKGGFSNEELCFLSSISDISEQIDFIYSSCTLHYVPLPYEEMRSLTSLNAKWILFNRMMFIESELEIVTIQKSLLSSNGPGKLPENYSDKLISYPHTTLSLPKFVREMRNHNYEVEWIFDDFSEVYKTKSGNVFGKSILFKQQLKAGNL